jgi:MFS family permease
MANPYREIFEAPGAFAFSAAGLVARMPISMTGIGIVTMLSQLRGEYWLAGTVAATFALASALIAPQISRLVDRLGQGRVLLRAAAVSVAAMVALLLCVRLEAPDWTLFLFAVIAGCMPSMPAMVRARWTELYRDSPKLHTAFSLESVLDEVCFIVGPVVSVGLSVAVFPEAGPLAAAVFLGVGILLFAAQRSTEPPVHPQTQSGDGSVIRIGALRVLVFTLAAMGAIFGTVDVVSIAFAESQGRTAAASVVLAVYAIGSCLAGLVFGALKLRMPLPRQFLIGVTMAAVTMLPLLVVDSVAMLTVAVFFAGMTVAPTLIITMGLVERIVPASKLTEGMTWAITGLGIGIALGSGLSGWVVDAFGPQVGFGVAPAAAAIALLTALFGYRLLWEKTMQAATVGRAEPAVAS